MRTDAKGLKRFVGLCLLLGIFVVFTATGAFGSSEGEHGAEPKGWVATDTYRVINFVILAAALVFLLRKPLSQALSGRIRGIREQLDTLEAKKEEAEKELAQYSEKLALLDQEAQKLVETYIQQGNEAKARILKEAEAAAAKLEEQARHNIEHEFAQMQKKLQGEVLEKALAKAEEIIKGKMTSADQERLVDEYLKKVVA